MTDLPRLGMEIDQITRHLDCEIGKSDGSAAQLLHALEQLRSATSKVLLNNILAAAKARREDNLWEAHLKVRNKFRSDLAKLRERQGGNSNVREYRSASKEYLHFIKQSQIFYRNHITKLAITYDGIPALEQVARKLPNQDNVTLPKTRLHVDQSVRDLVFGSCYRTLVQLGDLCRYRSSAPLEGPPKWFHAIGYYDLARAIFPSSGYALNQLAVIGLQDGNLHRTVYFVYRALSAKEPHPQATVNLNKAFNKISATKDYDQLIRSSADKKNPVSDALARWHLRLVEKCARGKAFVEHDELEREVINHLQLEFKNEQQSNILRRVSLINIAAGQYAEQWFFSESAKTLDENASDLAVEELKERQDESMQSYIYFLCLNMKVFLTILQTFNGEVQKFKAAASPAGLNLSSLDLSTSFQKVLPELRLYSAWLVKNVSIMTNSIQVEKMDSLQKDFWVLMARCLSSVAETFPVEDLPELIYMLEEDADTVAFEPLDCEETREIWYTNGKLRREWFTIPESLRNVKQEMLSRVRQFLKMGLELAVKETTPLQFDEGKISFYYEESRDVSSNEMEGVNTTRSTQRTHTSWNSQAHAPSAVAKLQAQDRKAEAEAEAEAERMVYSLVDMESSGPALDPSKSMESLPDRDSPHTPSGVPAMSAASSTWKPEEEGNFASSSFPVGTDTMEGALPTTQNFSQRDQYGEFAGPPMTNASPSLAPGAERARPRSNRQSPTPDRTAQAPRQLSYAATLASYHNASPQASTSSGVNAATERTSAPNNPPRSTPRPNSSHTHRGPSSISFRPSSLPHVEPSATPMTLSPNHTRFPSGSSITSQPHQPQSLNAAAQSFRPNSHPRSAHNSNRNSHTSLPNAVATALQQQQPTRPTTRHGLGLGNGTFDAAVTPNSAATATTTRYGSSSIWSPRLGESAENDADTENNNGGWQQVSRSSHRRGPSGRESGSQSPALRPSGGGRGAHHGATQSTSSLSGAMSAAAAGAGAGAGRGPSSSRPQTANQEQRERDLGADDWRRNARPVGERPVTGAGAGAGGARHWRGNRSR